MKVDAKHPRGTDTSTSAGLTSNVLPEAQTAFLGASSQTGVSTRNALPNSQKLNENSVSHWYALRTTYGRERKAYDYLVAKGIKAFLPTITSIKIENGKHVSTVDSRLPNIFFAYGTEEEIKAFVYDNVTLPYLRFYYRHFHEGRIIRQVPLVVPDIQINSLKIICESEANDILISSTSIPKFESGQKVCVTDGAFKGVIGKVARYHGQQRVAVTIEGLVTMVTAYVPSVFLEVIE